MSSLVVDLHADTVLCTSSIGTRNDVVLPCNLAKAVDLYINGSIIVCLKISTDLLTMQISRGIYKMDDNA